jgi:isopentenyl-diphosphate delta-isomerase
MLKNQVVLVDSNDKAMGTMEKLEAHKKGLLHRAISVFIFNDKKELLLQRRAFDKYHSGGLWTNTCCSHPYPNEKIIDAANRRLEEEMGIITSLKKCFDFVYHAKLENDLIEHEYDHVFVGFSNQTPHLNLVEASSFKWLSMDEIKSEIVKHPHEYTEWFKLLIHQYSDKFSENIYHESLQKS